MYQSVWRWAYLSASQPLLDTHFFRGTLELAGMQTLDLRGNQLTGDLSVIGSMPYLARAYLASNQLSGTIPAQMASSVLQVRCILCIHHVSVFL